MCRDHLRAREPTTDARAADERFQYKPAHDAATGTGTNLLASCLRLTLHSLYQRDVAGLAIPTGQQPCS